MAEACRCCALGSMELYPLKIPWHNGDKQTYVIIYVCIDCTKHIYPKIKGPDPVTALEMLPLCPVIMDRIKTEEKENGVHMSGDDCSSSEYEDIPLNESEEFGADTPDPFPKEEIQHRVKTIDNVDISWIYDISYF